MKGKMKKALCGVLTAVMLLSIPVAAQAETIIVAGIETEVGHSEPIKPEYSKTNTKAKTVTLYAGLRYGFQGNGFKRAKATWKISNSKYATLKSHSNGTADVYTKKAGRFTITAKQGSKSYTYKVTVKEDLSKRVLYTQRKGNKITWKKMPGATGYLVYRQYFPEGPNTENGWKAQEIVELKDLKGSNHTSYTITEKNWQEFRNANWAYIVRPYKKSGNKIILSSRYPEDMTFNTVRLR
ncbi:MAG: hypothetical protein ACOYBE_08425 [Blautia sp.]|jgi:hypothetical protein